MIRTLLTNTDVHVICRSDDSGNSFDTDNNSFTYTVSNFSHNNLGIEDKRNYLGFFSEVRRNLSLIYSVSSAFIRHCVQNKSKNQYVYAVSSPLTIPLIPLILSKLLRVTPYILEMHDLEPELSIELKHLNTRNLIYKIECLIERIVCASYANIIVTSPTQKHALVNRTGVNPSKIYIIENLVEAHEVSKTKKPKVFTKGPLNVGYVSSNFFGSYENGLKKFLMILQDQLRSFPAINIVIIGSGEGLDKLKSFVKGLELQKNVTFIGEADLHSILPNIQVGLIPWENNQFTHSVLPTRLFEHMKYGNIILAPNFGNFPLYVTNNHTGFLFRDIPDAIHILRTIYKNKSKYDRLKQAARSNYRNIENKKKAEIILKSLCRQL